MISQLEANIFYNLRSVLLLNKKQIAENKTEYINTVAHKQIALNQLDSLIWIVYLCGLKL